VVALLKDKFTAIQNNDLYIAGESYAGIYVPQLVLRLDAYINGTKPGEWSPKLKGFMVGNGVTNWKYDGTPAYFHISYYHGMISDELYENVKANCNLTYYDSPNPPEQSPQCQTWMDKFFNLTSLVNVYDIFGKCYQDPSMKRKIHGMTALKEVSDAESEKLSAVAGFSADKYTPFSRSANRPNLKEIPPCIFATPILDYFRNQTVMEALHVSPKAA
jgi:carboxypeptidase C (cathepsin A)